MWEEESSTRNHRSYGILHTINGKNKKLSLICKLFEMKSLEKCCRISKQHNRIINSLMLKFENRINETKYCNNWKLWIVQMCHVIIAKVPILLKKQEALPTKLSNCKFHAPMWQHYHHYSCLIYGISMMTTPMYMGW